MKLSILVPSVHTRRTTYLPKALDMLYSQYDQLSEQDKREVEILFLVDNKTMVLGAKRNKLVNLAQGKYVVFVDDDDRVAPNYMKSILDAVQHDTDAIVFQASVSINGAPAKICHYSKDSGHDYNTNDAYYRVPNHICCVKKEVSLKSSFPDISYGEDSGYSKALLPYLKTEHKIEEVLYYYDYNVRTSETHQWRNNPDPSKESTPVADIIILSKATTPAGRSMTQQTVKSCYEGTSGLPVNITVLEQGHGEYQYATTIHKPEPFNYNRFANFGAELGTAEWIVVANNDLIFHDGWLKKLIAAKHPIVSPHDPSDKRQKGIGTNESGYINGRHFSGWCFMIKRSLWEEIGKFDDCVTFWCSDDVVIEQLKAKGIRPMIVKSSVVQHAGSRTVSILPVSSQNDLKWRNVFIFNQKYGQHRLSTNLNYTRWLKMNRLADSKK